MARHFKRERAAACLADAAYYGDKEACQKHGVSVESLYRWRKLIDGDKPPDPILAGYVARNLTILRQRWASKLPRAIENTIEALDRFAKKKSHDVSEVALLIESLKMQAQVQMANRLMPDAQPDSRRIGSDGGPASPVPGTEVGFLPAPDDEGDTEA